MRQPQSLLRFLAASAVLLGTIMVVSPVSADETTPGDYGDTVHVIQPKPVLQKGRLDVTPRVGMTINDPLYRNFKIAAHANFHISERLYLGALFQWYDFGDIIGGDTRTFREVNAETQAIADAPFLNWAGGAEVGFVPLFGKFALFNQGVIYYDISVTGGAVYADTSSISAPAISDAGPGGTVSISGRFFMNDWMAFNAEVRDVIYSGNVSGVGSVLSHSLTVGLGMSFYLPTSFEYSE